MRRFRTTFWIVLFRRVARLTPPVAASAGPSRHELARANLTACPPRSQRSVSKPVVVIIVGCCYEAPVRRLQA